MQFPLTAAHDKKWLGICKYEEPEAQHQSVRMLVQPTYPDHGPGRVVHGGGGASASPHNNSFLLKTNEIIITLISII